MKLNKKGITLMELMVTIILIGIVLLFLFQLLLSIKGETETNTFAYNNQYNRTEELYKIVQDIRKNNLTGIFPIASTNKILLGYKFTFTEDRDSTMTIEKEGNKYYLYYDDINNNKNRWQMKSVNIDPCVNFIVRKGEGTNDQFYFKLAIRMYNNPYHELNNKKYNNLVDDLEIMGLGYKGDITSDTNNLLNTDISNHNIGTCTD